MTTAVGVHVHAGMVGMTILREGTDRQKETCLPQLAAGERIGAFAWSEPSAGSDAGGLMTRAVRDGDGYILTGRKAWISNGAVAGLFLVFASLPKTDADGGLGAFLVEREMDGLHVGRVEPTLGLRGLGITPLYLDGVRVPASNLLGGVENEGYAQAMRALDYGRMSVSAIALGAAQQALDYGVKFASERVQFGVPIGQKQSIQSYLADGAAKIMGLRHLVSYVAWLASGQWATLHPRCCCRQAARRRDSHVGCQQSGAGPRWIRLHEGVSHRAHLSRLPRPGPYRRHRPNAADQIGLRLV